MTPLALHATSLPLSVFKQWLLRHMHKFVAQTQVMLLLLLLAGLWLLLAALAAGCALHVVASWLLNLVASKVR